MKKSKKNSALVLSAPFLLTTVAIILLSIGFVLMFLKSNVYYRLLTNAPREITEDLSDSYLTLDDLTKEKLKENNKGLRVRSDFPPIAIGEQWATITIESAGVDHIPVYNAQDDYTLMLGIGHSNNSRFPGQNGRIVLPGHVGISRYFQRLETMQPGDLVVLNTIYGDYVYKVSRTVIFDESDNSWVTPLDDKFETEDELICYTCYPFNTTSVRTQRFAIVCEKVSGEDWTVEG